MTSSFLSMADRLRRALLWKRPTMHIPTTEIEALMIDFDDMQEELSKLKNAVEHL